MSNDARVKELGLELPPAPAAMGVYRPVQIVGSLLYTSGHGPINSDGSLITGRVGNEVDLQGGYEAARQTGLTILATLQSELGSLDRIARLVKLTGMVNCTPDFTDLPAVINGCSELFGEVFGPDAGIAARSAIGVASLPAGMTTEIEAIFELV
jgi:enamine deaminase RidA (YjgF/YER057c/UK114 family)